MVLAEREYSSASLCTGAPPRCFSYSSLFRASRSLRESVAQLREAYQSQLSIQQNDLMKIFTVVTAVFLPLTLLVGWYGMNFVGMPELHWKYGYPAVILVSVGIVAALVIYFKKKKWL